MLISKRRKTVILTFLIFLIISILTIFLAYYLQSTSQKPKISNASGIVLTQLRTSEIGNNCTIQFVNNNGVDCFKILNLDNCKNLNVNSGRSFNNLSVLDNKCPTSPANNYNIVAGSVSPIQENQLYCPNENYTDQSNNKLCVQTDMTFYTKYLISTTNQVFTGENDGYVDPGGSCNCFQARNLCETSGSNSYCTSGSCQNGTILDNLSCSGGKRCCLPNNCQDVTFNNGNPINVQCGNSIEFDFDPGEINPAGNLGTTNPNKGIISKIGNSSLRYEANDNASGTVQVSVPIIQNGADCGYKNVNVSINCENRVNAKCLDNITTQKCGTNKLTSCKIGNPDVSSILLTSDGNNTWTCLGLNGGNDEICNATCFDSAVCTPIKFIE